MRRRRAVWFLILQAITTKCKTTFGANARFADKSIFYLDCHIKKQNLMKKNALKNVIVVIGERFLFDLVPEDQQRKIIWVNIGPDRWYNPTHPELVGKLLKVLDLWGKSGAILPYTDPELPPELLDIRTNPSP